MADMSSSALWTRFRPLTCSTKRVAVLPSDIAPHRRMNLAPVQVEHAHGDGVRWPVDVGDKHERARGVPRVGMLFPNDAGRPVNVSFRRNARRSTAVNHDLAAAISAEPPTVAGQAGTSQFTAGPRQRTTC
jgi:hypothetical protein